MIIKPFFYDEFKCIADKCTYTCCEEWNIVIDSETRAKYDKCNVEYVVDDLGRAMVPIKDNKECVYLDENGMCRLVRQHGYQMLSHTCDLFPRKYQSGNSDVVYLGLSAACPAVLQFLMEMKEPYYFVQEQVAEIKDNSKYMDTYVSSRDFAIDLIQVRDLPLWVRLYILYSYAGKVDEAVENGKVDEVIAFYNDVDQLIRIYSKLMNMDSYIGEQLQFKWNLLKVINEENTKSIGYRKYIAVFWDKVDGCNVAELKVEYEEFEKIYAIYDVFLENLCVNMIYTDAIACKKNFSFFTNIKLIIIQLAIIKMTMFMNWLYDDQYITEGNLIDVATYYLRIISHNSFARDFVEDFSKEGFLGKGNIFLLIR